MYYVDIIINKFYDLECFDIMPGLYKINRDGILINKKTNNILHPSISSDGYMQINLKSNKGKKKPYRFHRLVAYMFCDGYSDVNNEVNHKNGKKMCNIPENLEWCDKSYNNKYRHIIADKMNYKFKEPPTFYGEDNTVSIFTNEFVHIVCKSIVSHNFSTKLVLNDLFINNDKYNKKQLRELINGIKYKKCWKIISDNYF